MMVWHYTTEMHLNAIYADGCLKPTAIKIPRGEIPALWFSANQTWEATANKSIMKRSTGEVRQLKGKEMPKFFRLVRFGIDSSKLMHWPELRKAARISFTEQRRLIKNAKKVGGVPHEWYGTLESIPLSELVREDLITMGGMTGWFKETTDHAEYQS